MSSKWMLLILLLRTKWFKIVVFNLRFPSLGLFNSNWICCIIELQFKTCLTAGPQNTAGPAWEEHRRIFGFRPSSGASRSRPVSGNSRGRGRRQPAAFSPYFHRKNTWTRAFVCLAFSEQNALPSTSEKITLTLNGLTSVIDCGTPSKPPPKCTNCCSICCKRKLTKWSVSLLALNCNVLDRSSREFLSRAKKSVRSIPSAIFWSGARNPRSQGSLLPVGWGQ